MIARVRGASISGNRRNDAGGEIYAAQPIVAEVSKVEVSYTVEAYCAGRSKQICTHCKTAISREAAGPCARHRCDDPGNGIDFADAVVRVVGDVEITGPIQSDSIRPIQFGAGGCASVPRVTGSARTGNDTDFAR